MDRAYFSQLSNEELEQRLLLLLETDAKSLDDLQYAVRAVESVAIADELRRRGVLLTGPE